MEKKTIVCFGPGPQFKGGLANFNTSLAKTLDLQGHKIHLISWSQQYPAIIPRNFVDSSSATHFLENTNISIDYLLNYNLPNTWYKTAKAIIQLKPDFVIVQWAIALQGIPLYFLTKKLKKAGIGVIYDCHFVFQKEASKLDFFLTKKTLQLADKYITHSSMTSKELQSLFPKLSKEILELYHPVYSIFTPNHAFDSEQFKKEFGLRRHVFLFFGFIRPYKGLHNTIRAFSELEKQRDDVSLLICGESFWDTVDDSKFINKVKKALFNVLKFIFLTSNKDKGKYNPLELLNQLKVKHAVVFNDFIPNQEVHKYFQASDATVLFYDNSSPSGVESLSYNFLKPIIATDVGHFKETISNGKNGYLAKAGDIKSMTGALNNLIENPIKKEDIEYHVQSISWENYANKIVIAMSTVK